MPALPWPWVRLLLMLSVYLTQAHALGSMNSMAASYGENGQALCSLRADKANVVTCFGSDVASVYGAPPRLPLLGLTGELLCFVPIPVALVRLFNRKTRR